MTLDQIKRAVELGRTVYWSNRAYTVIKDSLGQWLVVCSFNGYATCLTRADGVTMNGKPDDFFTPSLIVDTPPASYPSLAIFASELMRLSDRALLHLEENERDPDRAWHICNETVRRICLSVSRSATAETTLIGQYGAHARLDADGKAKPLTRLVGHVRPGDCVGPGSVQADALEVVATGERTQIGRP